MARWRDNAQYFEDQAPWAAQYKKQGVKPPRGQGRRDADRDRRFPRHAPIGDNLPNENEIHEKYGTQELPVHRQLARARTPPRATAPRGVRAVAAGNRRAQRSTATRPRT